MTNPFVKPPSVDKRLMTPRTALVPSPTVPAGEALDNWQPEELVDGALCFVLSEAAIYQFDKFSASAPSGNTVIATIKGTSVLGRWLLLPLGAAEKAYRALSYARPNTSGVGSSLSALPLVIATWTRFDLSVHAVEIASLGDLSFDGDKAVVVARDMTVQIDWYLSWFAIGGTYHYEGAVLVNGSVPAAGSRCIDYYNSISPAMNSVMTGTTIIDLVKDDTLEIMVQAIDAPDEAIFVADYGNLVVVEL